MKKLNKKGKIALYLHLINSAEFRLDSKKVDEAEKIVCTAFDDFGEIDVEISFCGFLFPVFSHYFKGEKDERI